MASQIGFLIVRQPWPNEVMTPANSVSLPDGDTLILENSATRADFRTIDGQKIDDVVSDFEVVLDKYSS